MPAHVAVSAETGCPNLRVALRRHKRRQGSLVDVGAAEERPDAWGVEAGHSRAALARAV